jgi:hypothetical protein
VQHQTRPASYKDTLQINFGPSWSCFHNEETIHRIDNT